MALAERSGDAAHTLRQAEAAVASARKALENLARFVASHSSNPVMEEHYQTANREWRSATARLAVARAQRQDAKPLRVSEAEARDYAANLAMHVQESDTALRRRFLAAFIRRIVLYDEEGIIELAEQATLEALRAVEEKSSQQTMQGTPSRRRRHYAPRLIRERAPNIPIDGTPNGIRTRDLHLERVSRPVQRRISTSMLIERIQASWGFASAVVCRRRSALLSGLLSPSGGWSWMSIRRDRWS